MDGQRLRDARNQRRMTQAHLALAAGVSERTIIRAERGIPVAAESWRSICAALGVDASAPAQAVTRTPEPILPDVARWHAENGFALWSSVAAVALAGCMTAAGFSLATVLASDDPTQSLAGASILALASASATYIGMRIRRYASLARSIGHRSLEVEGTEVLIHEEVPGTGVRTMTRIGPCTGIAEARPYVLWPRARVSRLALANGRSIDIDGISATAIAGRLVLGSELPA